MAILNDPLQQFLNSLTYNAMVLGVWLFIVASPLVLALAIRFLWFRHVYVGRSQELEKLIWQLHRIASALESKQQPADKPDLEPTVNADRSIPLSMFGR